MPLQNLSLKVLLVIAVVLLGALAFLVFPWQIAIGLAVLVAIFAFMAYIRDY